MAIETARAAALYCYSQAALMDQLASMGSLT